MHLCRSRTAGETDEDYSSCDPPQPVASGLGMPFPDSPQGVLGVRVSRGLLRIAGNFHLTSEGGRTSRNGRP